MNGEAINTWLHPLHPMLDPAERIDWRRLGELATTLDTVLATCPVGPDIPPGAERSRRLQAIRREVAGHGHLDTTTAPSLFGVLAQFVCGYRDIDLRDGTGLGHGQLVARHATVHTRRRWLPRLLAGELAGIAVTEPHGGSRPAATRTYVTLGPDGTWLLTGRKTWISRLTEAAVFVVFFRDPHGELAAAVVDAASPGLRREPIPPTGLAGWSWGILDLDHVPICPQDDVLRGDGMVLLREHFAGYRPLVTATALGGAAAVFDTVTAALTVRQQTGDLARLRDTTLVTLGRTHAQLVSALLGVVVAADLADNAHPQSELWGAAMKAHGVDTANQAAAELALLLGAAGFQAESQIAKTRRDLNGLLYADGIHDGLYRVAGKHHTTPTPAVPTPRHPVSATA